MDKARKLAEYITLGIQEKKGRNIVVADLTGIEDTICKYFVICQGSNPNQLSAIVDSVFEYVLRHRKEKPLGIEGLRNSQWVIMDYADVMVHIFLPEVREYYNLENLWADAMLTNLPDVD